MKVWGIALALLLLCSCSAGKEVPDVSVEVEAPSPNLVINTMALYLNVGQSAEVKVDLLDHGDVKDVTYRVGNDSIATVDSLGNVTAVSAGVTYVMCSFEDEEVSCNIIVP